jgi:hypothetical protein
MKGLSKIHAQGFLKEERHVQTRQWHGYDFDGKTLTEIQIVTSLESQLAIDCLIDMLIQMRPCLPSNKA